MANAALRVALVADNGQREGFRSFLESQGINLVVDVRFGVPLPRSLNDAEVLLVATNGSVAAQRLEGLLAQSPVPVLINEGCAGSSEIWSRELLAKLEGLARGPSELGRRMQTGGRPGLRVVAQVSSVQPGAMRVVVLGGSIGGPEAVTRFLRALPCHLPLVFLLAQHISRRFQDLLAAQLNRSSGWQVAVLSDRHRLEPGWVWLLPADSRVSVEPSGMLRLCPDAWESVQKPDINAVLSGVANSFGARSGAIMFSGLKGDGAQGCEVVARHGGFVWTQSAKSCTLANLPMAVERSAVVEFSGTPEQLAQQLAFRCRQQSTTIN